MAFYDNLVKFTILDYSIYPEINLIDSDSIKLQTENIRKFKSLKNKLYLAIILFCSELFLFNVVILDYFKLSRKEGEHHFLQFGFMFLMVILIIVYMYKFKCPKCGTVPQGKSIDLTGGVAYTKGINPFPSRCACCGFYLRESALKRDMKLQGIQNAEKERCDHPLAPSSQVVEPTTRKLLR